MAATSIRARKLTPKQAAFVREYTVDFNATRAARAAGYSEKTAEQLGYQLLQVPSVQLAIRARQSKVEARSEATVERIVEELCAIAFADILDYARVETIEVPVKTANGVFVNDDGKVQTMTEQTVTIVETAALSAKQRKAVAEIKPEFSKFGDRVIGLKLHNKTTALELLGKHLGMWADKLDIKVQGQVENLLESLRGRVSEQTYAELLRAIAQASGFEGVATAPAPGSETAGSVH